MKFLMQISSYWIIILWLMQHRLINVLLIIISQLWRLLAYVKESCIVIIIIESEYFAVHPYIYWNSNAVFHVIYPPTQQIHIFSIRVCIRDSLLALTKWYAFKKIHEWLNVFLNYLSIHYVILFKFSEISCINLSLPK